MQEDEKQDVLYKPGHKLVPTIGVLPYLEGLEQSGAIITFTDSDCLNGDRTIKDCLKLIEFFTEIATAPTIEERRKEEEAAKVI